MWLYFLTFVKSRSLHSTQFAPWKFLSVELRNHGRRNICHTLVRRLFASNFSSFPLLNWEACGKPLPSAFHLVGKYVRRVVLADRCRHLLDYGRRHRCSRNGESPDCVCLLSYVTARATTRLLCWKCVCVVNGIKYPCRLLASIKFRKIVSLVSYSVAPQYGYGFNQKSEKALRSGSTVKKAQPRNIERSIMTIIINITATCQVYCNFPCIS